MRKTQQNKGWHNSRFLSATLRLAATPRPLRSLVSANAPGTNRHWGRNREINMPHLGSMPDPEEKPRTIMVGWISRLDLALELDLSVDTLRRWEAQRTGPTCVRAGRKVYYRRSAVEAWLEDQELNAPRRRRAGGRR